MQQSLYLTWAAWPWCPGVVRSLGAALSVCDYSRGTALEARQELEVLAVLLLDLFNMSP
jgi:hypothetical protein